MCKLIDADALYDFCSEQRGKETGAYSKGLNKAFNIVRSALHCECATPTIDPIHAAGGCYCRECKYFVEHDNHTDTFCKKGVVLFRIKENDFCSYGKVRTE